ncbi:DMT family transporter [Pseudoxanthomonas wuyuanensis]|uniref:Permease of the drug/metabolite transporter (DMT) superfamily n=1 Tax=Pseudoxanthomonas wuyuanensis TaxID=1073196 RepID=A0A286CVR1_9GAMM|nr:DMT family transporter [Pseudoxanthomonas wuyuanensis]KAF1721286.1 EamA/RhaT family transporter [Pseudoxanthomonas wuyuanensis]SOD50483.1 Permease of the drug/metabolite transporter (DMT) superfamily [Pseudoxanthomonas wuyuanensis]
MPAIPHHFRAAALMLGSTMFFGLMVVSIRLASATLHTFEIAFFRNFFGLIVALPLLLRHGPGFLRTTQFPRYLFRCVIGICSMLAGFWAIGHLPLAQAVSLSYSTPLFVTIAAAAMLNEQVRARRWTAVLLGFIGVLIIVRPGTAEFSMGAIVAVLAAVLSSIVAIQIKQLSQTEPADRIVIYTTLLWVPMSLLPALSVWQWPQGITWLWVVAAGVMGTGGHMLWTRALKLGEVSALTPISFMQLPIVAVFGWWLFDESLDRWTLLGAGIIFAANAYIAHREATLAKRAATESPTSAAKPGE